MLSAFRQWRQRSLANSIALQASLLAIGSGLLVAIISLIVLYWSQKLVLHDQIAEKATRLTERVERTINVAESASADLAKNTIFTSALLDSAGRNAYVEPFLKNFTLPIPAANGIALCDINGMRLAGTKAGLSDCHADSPLFRQVLQDGKTARALLPLANGHLAWTIFRGVAYTYTGTIEGVVVTQIDLYDIFAPIPNDLELKRIALVRRQGDAEILSLGSAEAVSSGRISGRRALFGNSPEMTPFPLDVVLWSQRTPFGGTLTPLLLSYSLGLLLLFLGVMLGTRRLSLRLIKPLARLTDLTREIAATGNMAVEIPSGQHGELRQLSSAFQTMVNTVRHSEAHLESQVMLRTRQLQTAEAALRSVFDAATGMGIIAMDTAGRVTLFNPGAERILGYQAEEVIGKMTLSQLHRQDDPNLPAIDTLPATQNTELERLLTYYGVDDAEAREWPWLRRDGVILTISLALTTIRDDHGEVSGYLGIAEDITARKGIELELVLSHDRLLEQESAFRTLVENTPDTIARYDRACHRIYANPALLRLLGKQADEVIGVALTNGVANPIEIERYQEKIRAVLATGQSETFLLEWINDLGETVFTDIRLIPERDMNGNVASILGIGHEVTDQKRTEQLLEQARDQAEAMARAKSEFLANMSHEIRTPMNGIIGLTQLALNQQTSPELRDYLNKISSSSQSLLGILNDILDFSKLDAGRMTVEQQPFNLDTVLDNLHNLFDQRAQAKGLDFSIEIADHAPRDNLIGDALRLQQILSNLLGNAFKFTHQGQVTLQVAVLEQNAGQVKLRFAVTDTGIGVSEEEQAHLFQPFRQADGSITRRFGGTGLGLAISRDLLSLMGAEIRIASRLQQGSTFSFELLLNLAGQAAMPMVRQRATHEAGGLERELEAKAGLLHGARILVAEDNSINQQIVQEFLTLSGMVSVIANNGQEAIRQIEAQPFDAVLMDISMPVMGGIEATSYLRRQEAFNHLPIIALTAGVTEAERENCLACGMNDFLPKPINPQQLIDTLARWLHPASAVPPPVVANATASEERAGPELVLAGFDLHNLRAMLGGDAGLLLELLRVFRQDLAELPAQIQLALASNDYQRARELAHQIKGAAGNVGAMELHRTAGVLEAECKAGSCQPATLDSFTAAFAEAMSAIDGLPQP